jgi:putative ABC transport system substrate-binding protein
MRRREFIALMGASFASPFAARAQEPGRIYRLGSLEPNPRDWPLTVAYFDELRRRGFVEGQNLTIDYRNFAPHVDLISEYAAELVKAKPEVIYAGGGVAVRAVQQATKTLPIVGVADDMLEEGLVESLARPNGNTTGISILATDLRGAIVAARCRAAHATRGRASLQ